MRVRIGVRGLAVAALGASAALGSAQVAIDNGPFQTHANGGFGGAPRSVLQNSTLGLENFGFGCQKVNGNRLADDFVVPASSRLRMSGVRLYQYQTGATSNTINDVNVAIWAGGAPNAGGSIVHGSQVTNIFTNGSSTGVYRVDDTTGTTANNRLIMEIRAAFGLPVVLNPGTYWADFQSGGTGSSGPWHVPVTILGQVAKPGANAIQFLGGGINTWGPALDDSGPQQDMAFRVVGTWLESVESFVHITGDLLGGNLASLSASDNNSLVTLNDEFTPNSNVEFNATSPIGTVASFVLTVETSASRNDLTQRIEMLNVSNVWETLDIGTTTLSDFTDVINVSVNPNRFIRAGNALKMRIRTIPQVDVNAVDGWASRVDFIEWELTPP